ncbi:MAG: DNA/RNA non-specific endonuclease [Kordiimonadaceae bacterium]|nr:DNA/RNA non-specific endonuclease [Kordiimonadaceae bacterium]
MFIRFYSGEYMMRILVAILLAAIWSSTSSAACHQHDEFGIKDRVKGGQIDRELCREGYAVGYNEYYKSPIWVAYKITKSSVEGGVGRTTKFKADMDLPEESRATLWDYKYSGYDRGHMAPSATMDFNKNARDESYYLSNMTPQIAGLNQQGWKYLEAFFRDIAIEHKTAYVVTGAIFDGNNRTIGNGVHVPSHLYKVIYIPRTPGNEVMFGFLIPNENFNIKDLKKYQMPVKKIQNRAGLDFFHKLKNSLEKQLEKSRVDYCAIMDVKEPTACE